MQNQLHHRKFVEIGIEQRLNYHQKQARVAQHRNVRKISTIHSSFQGHRGTIASH
jgi:hypothetical protein